MKRLERIPSRTIGLGFLAVFSAITLIAFTGIWRTPFEADTRTVVADFESGGQLYKGDDVRLEGDINGSVKKVEPSPVAGLTRVTMAVETSAGPVYADAKARLRIKTLLAGSFYVQLERGDEDAGVLAEDAVIGRADTSVQVEIDDVLDIFREPALQGFKTLPGEFGEALADGEQIGTDLGIANDIAPDATETLSAVRGQVKGDDLPRLIRETAKTTAILDADRGNVQALVSGAAATLQTTGRRDAEIRETIDAAPSVTFDMTQTLARLDRTLDIADGLITKLQPAADDVAPALTRLQPALVSTRHLLDEARPLVSRFGNPLLGNLGASSRSVIPLVNQLKPALQKLDDTVLPYMARKDPDTGMSSTVMIGGTAAGFGGASGQMDENGHFIRFPASVGLSSPSLYLPCKSSLIDPTAPSLLACDSFNDAVTEYLNYLPELDGALGGPAK